MEKQIKIPKWYQDHIDFVLTSLDVPFVDAETKHRITVRIMSRMAGLYGHIKEREKIIKRKKK